MKVKSSGDALRRSYLLLYYVELDMQKQSRRSDVVKDETFDG